MIGEKSGYFGRLHQIIQFKLSIKKPNGKNILGYPVFKRTIKSSSIVNTHTKA